MFSLPNVKDVEAFEAWRADASRCLPAALDIARSHRLPMGRAPVAFFKQDLSSVPGQPPCLSPA